MKITIIAALGEDRAIGINGELPWRLAQDLKLFRRNTIDRAVVMGYDTAKSIGMTLPKRMNVVLSSRRQAPYPGQHTARSIKDALRFLQAQGAEDVCVIGGQRVYEQFLPLAHRLHLSYVPTTVPNADAWFPEVNEWEWQLVTTTEYTAVEGERFGFTYREFVRYDAATACSRERTYIQRNLQPVTLTAPTGMLEGS